MWKPVVLILLLALTMGQGLVGCMEPDPPKTEPEVRNFTNVPPELKDCKAHYLVSDKGHYSHDIVVFRCPNSTTSTTQRVQSGKVTVVRKVTVIDGSELDSVPEEK